MGHGVVILALDCVRSQRLVLVPVLRITPHATTTELAAMMVTVRLNQLLEFRFAYRLVRLVLRTATKMALFVRDFSRLVLQAKIPPRFVRQLVRPMRNVRLVLTDAIRVPEFVRFQASPLVPG